MWWKYVNAICHFHNCSRTSLLRFWNLCFYIYIKYTFALFYSIKVMWFIFSEPFDFKLRNKFEGSPFFIEKKTSKSYKYDRNCKCVYYTVIIS